MRIFSRRSVVAVTLLALVVALASATASSAGPVRPASATAPKAKTLTVALVADLTGFFAANSGWQGAMAYFKKFNASGGIHGVKIKVRIFDSGTDPQKALQATQAALAIHPAAYMSGSGALYTALPTVAQSGVPAIGDGFAPQWGAGYHNFFSVLGDLTTHLSSVWLNVLKSQGATKLALLTAPIEKGDIDLMAS